MTTVEPEDPKASAFEWKVMPDGRRRQKISDYYYGGIKLWHLRMSM